MEKGETNGKAVSGIMLTLLLIGTLVLAFNIKSAIAVGTIYIRADGSVDPISAPIQRTGDVYIFTDDINETIVVEKDSITIDGDGYALQGTVGSIMGIDLTERSSVTVANMYISNFEYGIWLYDSSSITLTNNVLASCEYGIRISDSQYNFLKDNTAMNNNVCGIFLWFSSYNVLSNNEIIDNFVAIDMQWGTGNTLRDNIMVGNKYSIEIGHYALSYYLHDIDSSNTINGKPLYYWINRHDETIPSDVGCVYIVNSTGIKVEHLTVTGNVYAVTIAFSTDCELRDVTATYNMYGPLLDAAEHNILVGNNVSCNAEGGFQLVDSSHNLLMNNVAINNTGLAVAGAAAGIYLEDTMWEVLKNNILTNNTMGIGVDDSSGIEIVGNDINSNTLYGIMVAGVCSDCTIEENDIIQNSAGMWMATEWVIGNRIFHNNFINNSKQIHIQIPIGSNDWDDGYHSGGNYWSDYLGWDADDDGIGDSPYVINERNRDRYPLMSPYGNPPLPKYILTITATAGGTTNPAPGNYTHSKGQNIPVNATPSAGYLFDHWELDGVNIGTTIPMKVTMNANHTLHAVFTATYTLTITATNGGRTNPTSGTYTHTAGTLVTVTATPNTHYYFDHWELDGNNYTNNPITVAMNTDRTLKASFARIQYTLTVTTTDGGTTNPTPGTHTYWSGTMASITALPNTGYYLDHWELDSVNIGIPNPVNITMNTNHTLHTIFRQLSPGHDVAIKDVTSKTVVGQGYSSTIRVTAMNIGSYTETFNVTIHLNANSIASRSVTIESGIGITITFTWDTTGFAKGNYTISANATMLPDETNTTDNTFIDGWIIVAMMGDITGGTPNVWDFIPDGKVNIKDIAVVANLFGVIYPDPRYEPNCDLTGPTIGVPDGKINIRDIALVASHYGETYP